MTTADLLDFVALAVEIAQAQDMPLIEALDEAAHLYPQLAAVPADAPACELVTPLPFDPRFWG